MISVAQPQHQEKSERPRASTHASVLVGINGERRYDLSVELDLVGNRQPALGHVAQRQLLLPKVDVGDGLQGAGKMGGEWRSNSIVRVEQRSWVLDFVGGR